MSNALKLGSPLKLYTNTANPGSPEDGFLYYNTSEDFAKVYANGTWEQLAPKSYVDAVASGLDPKASVRIATTADIADLGDVDTTSTAIFDGLPPTPLAVNDRVLVRAQSDNTQNGIYRVASIGVNGSLVRASDMDGTPSNEVSGGNYTFVENGTLYAGTGWVLLGDGILTLGSSAIVWSQFSAVVSTLQAAYDGGQTIDITTLGSSVSLTGDNTVPVLDVTNIGTGPLAKAARFSCDTGSGNAVQIISNGINSTALRIDSESKGIVISGAGNFGIEISGGDSECLVASSTQDVAVARFTSSAAAGNALELRQLNASGHVLQMYDTDESNYVGIKIPDLTANYTLTLPVDAGTSGQFLQTGLGGALSWATVSTPTLQQVYNADIDGGDATILTNATDGAVVIDGTEKLWVTAANGIDLDSIMTINTSLGATSLSINALGSGAIGISVNSDGSAIIANNASVADPTVEIQSDHASGTALRLRQVDAGGHLMRMYNTANTFYVGIKASTSMAANYTLTLPVDDGTPGQFLQTGIGGALSWADATFLGGAGILLSGGDTFSVDLDQLADASTSGVDGGSSGLEFDAIGVGGLLRVRVDGTTIERDVTGVRIAAGAAGAGLTGGGGSALAVGAGSYITVNTNDVAVDVSTLSAFQSGAGLTDSAGVLAVGAGSYITVNTNDVEVNISSLATALAAGSGSQLTASAGELFVTTTLHNAYKNDADTNDATITTDSSDGSVVIYGDQSFIVGATEGFKLAVTDDKTKFVQEIYKDGLSLTASSTLVLAGLNLAHATYSGQVIEYRIKEATTNAIRIGTLLVSTDGTLATVTDTYTETADVGVTWSAAVNGANVELTYTTTANAKTMHAALRRFLLA